MAKIEVSFPTNERINDRARKRIPFSARVNIQDIASEKKIVVSIEDPKMVRIVSEEFSRAGRVSFRSFARMYLIRNKEEVERTSISTSFTLGVHFQTLAKRGEPTV